MQATFRRDEKFNDRSVQFAMVASLFVFTGLWGALVAPPAMYDVNEALRVDVPDPAAPATIPGHAMLPYFLGVGDASIPTRPYAADKPPHAGKVDRPGSKM
jgi:hypothetical protein